MKTQVVVVHGDCQTSVERQGTGKRGLAAVKPELRIIWEMARTWVGLGWRRLRGV